AKALAWEKMKPSTSSQGTTISMWLPLRSRPQDGRHHCVSHCSRSGRRQCAWSRILSDEPAGLIVIAGSYPAIQQNSRPKLRERSSEHVVAPAKAGAQPSGDGRVERWAPAFAGATKDVDRRGSRSSRRSAKTPKSNIARMGFGFERRPHLQAARKAC